MKAFVNMIMLMIESQMLLVIKKWYSLFQSFSIFPSSEVLYKQGLGIIEIREKEVTKEV